MFEVLYEYLIAFISYILSWFGYEMKLPSANADDVEAKVELMPPVPSAPVELPAEIVA